MQLSQPIRAKHNGYARKSSLDFVLENLDTIPPEKGIFLNTTRRLNEKICSFRYVPTLFSLFQSQALLDMVRQRRHSN